MRKSFPLLSMAIVFFIGLCLAPAQAARAATGATGLWTEIASMNQARWAQTMTILPDGKAMVVSGCTNGYCSAFTPSYEIYDPKSGKWSWHELFVDGKYYAFVGLDAVVLADNTVLIAGVDSNGASILFDPQTSTWSKTGNLIVPRYHGSYSPAFYFSINRLANDGALVAGGRSIDTILKSADIYHPASHNWSKASDNTGIPVRQKVYLPVIIR